MIKSVDDLGKMIERLTNMYHNGQLDKLVIIAIQKDNTFDTGISRNMGYIETLGYLEGAKDLVNRRVD